MRRFRQQIPDKEAKEILSRNTNGVLALVDPEGKPYGVPMSFIFDGQDSIYFHCALEGRKLDCIKNSPFGCFTVINKDEISPERFTTYFESVIAEGKIDILKDREEIVDSLRRLSNKYSPGLECEAEIERGLNRVIILRLKIESLTGKEAIELTKRRGDSYKVNHN